MKKKLGFPKPIAADDPRLDGHTTVYRSSQAGFFPPENKPVPGTPKTDSRKKKGRL